MDARKPAFLATMTATTAREAGSSSTLARQRSQAAARRRTSSFALGLLSLRLKDHAPAPAPAPVLEEDEEEQTAAAPAPAPMFARLPRRSVTIDKQPQPSPLALALVEDEPPALMSVPEAVEERRPLLAASDSEDEADSRVQLRRSRSSVSSSAENPRRPMVPAPARHRPPAAAPYPRNYDRSVLDHDIWENEFYFELSGGVTWHDFKTPPKKVLDIGCGTGIWVLRSAQLWTDSHFVGLDIMPIQPDLHRIHSTLAPRIRWVNANFLEPLPFEDEEFDFVHIRRIARGVPEPKWDDFFDEVSRVLKKGGAIEIIEEDLGFPGSIDFPAEDDDLLSPGPSRVAESAKASKRHSSGSLIAPNGNTHGKPLINPHDHSDLEYIFNEMHAARWINLEVLSLLSSILAIHFVDVRSHAPVHVAFPQRPPVARVSRSASSSSGESANVSPVATRRESSRPRSSGGAKPEIAADVASAVPPRLRTHSMSKMTVPPSSAPPPPVPPIPPVPPVPSIAAQESSCPDAPEDAQRPTPKLAIPPDPISTSPFATSPYPVGAAMTNVHTKRVHSLPNTTWRFDANWLPLHLSCRVAEVRACTDAMWDWLRATGQGTDDPTGVRPPEPAAAAKLQAAALLNIGTSVVVGGMMGTSGFARDALNISNLSSAIAGGSMDKPVPSGWTPRGMRRLMTRHELERLVDRFEMDMHDHIGMSTMLPNRLGWSGPRDHAPSAERKAFDESVALWEDYVDQLNAQRAARGEPHQSLVPPLKVSRTMRAYVAWKAAS